MGDGRSRNFGSCDRKLDEMGGDDNAAVVAVSLAVVVVMGWYL